MPRGGGSCDPPPFFFLSTRRRQPPPPLPFGDEHWRLAAQAFGRYGKDRHPAGLNYGDCLTYATAKLAGEPLLSLGDDFAQTDLELVTLNA